MRRTSAGRCRCERHLSGARVYPDARVVNAASIGHVRGEREWTNAEVTKIHATRVARSSTSRALVHDVRKAAAVAHKRCSKNTRGEPTLGGV
jgi:hypothetical protein